MAYNRTDICIVCTKGVVADENDVSTKKAATQGGAWFPQTHEQPQRQKSVA